MKIQSGYSLDKLLLKIHMFKKTNYFYIDETGHLFNNSNVFILGCIRTDTPQQIENILDEFWNGLDEEIYFESSLDQIRSQGLHAVENHPDVRAKMYSKLPIMNYRSFFVIVNKTDPFFQNLKKELSMEDMYVLILQKILRDRIIYNKDKNIFSFEELAFPTSSQRDVLKRFFDPLTDKGNFEYGIVTKQNKIMPVTDYLNYIFFKLLDYAGVKEIRMKENLELILPKIALIHFLNKNIFLSRKGSVKINFENIIKMYGG